MPPTLSPGYHTGRITLDLPHRFLSLEWIPDFDPGHPVKRMIIMVEPIEHNLKRTYIADQNDSGIKRQSGNRREVL
jgi:hypothetical protein